ncbi:NUDIX domain-containing protein [Thalassotalea sp. G2M2-11]|uniref:NUDIX domain-containing protein n=1 Tax=Thalassotalea sp. G2M2-11 TaxID=2787627 RepID=UPI0019D201E6|nr:NUDIX domain-containing protein [Thalassotalea sp. G2M2-11]
MSTFHNIARALIINNNHVLLVRAKGAKNTFLPGGHIEFGETVQETIAREINEEIGYDCKVGDFVGAIEHMWPEDVKDNHEINLVFLVDVLGLDSSVEPESKESHLDLFWVKLSEIKNYNLQPSPLNDWVLGHANNNWATTINV